VDATLQQAGRVDRRHCAPRIGGTDARSAAQPALLREYEPSVQCGQSPGNWRVLPSTRESIPVWRSPRANRALEGIGPTAVNPNPVAPLRGAKGCLQGLLFGVGAEWCGPDS